MCGRSGRQPSRPGCIQLGAGTKKLRRARGVSSRACDGRELLEQRPTSRASTLAAGSLWFPRVCLHMMRQEARPACPGCTPSASGHPSCHESSWCRRDAQTCLTRRTLIRGLRTAHLAWRRARHAPIRRPGSVELRDVSCGPRASARGEARRAAAWPPIAHERPEGGCNCAAVQVCCHGARSAEAAVSGEERR